MIAVMLHLPQRPPCPGTAVLDPACVQTVEGDDDGGHPFGPPMPDLPAEIGGNVLEELAKAFRDAVGWMVSKTASWWVQTPPPDLEHEPAIGLLQHLTQPITIAVAMAAMLIVAGKMTLTRKANPLIDAGRGLVVLAVVTAIGAVLPNQLLQWGDQWSRWVLEASAEGGFATKMALITALPGQIPAVLVILLSLVALVVGIIQAFLMLFRGAALIILAGVLPLAAAGMITPATQPWFKKVTGWGLALIFYQPAAAAVYATAFILIGDGQGIHSTLMGFTMMLVSLIAFPVLLKFFTWTTSQAESGGSNGILGTVLSGAMTLGALRSYTAYGGSNNSQDTSASEHASYLRQQLGEQPGEQPSAENPPHLPNGQEEQQSTVHSNDQAPSAAQSQPTAEPTGSAFETSGNGAPGDHDGGLGQSSSDPAGEPVGPTAASAWDHERREASQRPVRWLGQPSGSNDGAGGPTGAAGAEGGGGGGA
ncbi:hypothetical protein ACGFNU_44130 [Spirillospora sp. NPDC048911]|uniref:hypothetical protein n=1 Tax=Spirillospora sp. NPDC048911 TaxID=3364527 RepID=UPI003716A4A5